MDNFNISGLATKLKEFSKERDWDQFHSPKNLSMALVIEASELLEHFQWLTEQQSKSLSIEQLNMVKNEIGDVLIYLIILCYKLDIDPLDAAFKKLEVNKIKYSIEKSKGTAKKLTDY